MCAQLCLTLWDPKDCNPPGSSDHGIFPGNNTGVGYHSILHVIFLTQGSNPLLLTLLVLCLCQWRENSQKPVTLSCS